MVFAAWQNGVARPGRRNTAVGYAEARRRHRRCARNRRCRAGARLRGMFRERLIDAGETPALRR